MTASAVTAASSPAAADLVARARELHDFMRERARQADESRHLLPEMVDAFTRAGLVRTLVPTRWGGAGLALTDALDITIEVARAHGSMGWVGSFWSDHPHWVGFYPEPAQQEVWADGPDQRIATSFVPVGKVTAADGGYRLSGEWAWASGVGFSAWVMLGALVPGDEGPLQNRLFLVPTADVTVVDTWFSAGLSGTGSDTVVAQDVIHDGYLRIGGVKSPALSLSGVRPEKMASQASASSGVIPNSAAFKRFVACRATRRPVALIRARTARRSWSCPTRST
jgi:alkylation response protein AidB-like acyl-CoA dehydrogenase